MTDQESTALQIEQSKPVSLTNSCNPHCVSLLAAALNKVNADAKISEDQLNELRAQLEGKLKADPQLEENSGPNETIRPRKAPQVVIENVSSHAAEKQCLCPIANRPRAPETPERIDLSLAFSTLGIQTNVNFTNLGDRVNTLQNIFGRIYLMLQHSLDDQNLRNTLAATVDVLLILYALSYVCIYVCNCYLLDYEYDD